jgi:predicted nucleotidyltransferase
MNKQLTRDKLRDVLAHIPEVRLAYLFGSQVDGPVGPLSDYDLGVLTERSQDAPQLRARLCQYLARAIETDQIDVVLLDRAPIELAYAIIAHGEVLYERDAATRVEYEAQVMGLYGDYLPVLRAQRHDILEEGGGHASRVQRHRAALGRTERTIGQIRAAQGEGAGRV